MIQANMWPMPSCALLRVDALLGVARSARRSFKFMGHGLDTDRSREYESRRTRKNQQVRNQPLRRGSIVNNKLGRSSGPRHNELEPMKGEAARSAK